MPVRNTVKYYDTSAFYHVYNRGAGDAAIFVDDQDRVKFLSLFSRHLDTTNISKKSDGIIYDKYDLELVAYCLMGNHFHLLLFQRDDVAAITKLMRSVATAYTMYFNHKYKKHGHLFQSIFKASRIDDDSYLEHITRYIHMNPRSYLRYRWSSIAYYLGSEPPRWLYPEHATSMPPAEYREFLHDYEGKKKEMELIKSQLAG